MKTRAEKESLIRDYADVAAIVEISPKVNTHLGLVTMLDKDATLIEEVAGDWCIQGTLQQLTDEEFDQIFSAVQRDAKKVLAYCCSK
jgi:hypothetical protein